MQIRARMTEARLHAVANGTADVAPEHATLTKQLAAASLNGHCCSNGSMAVVHVDARAPAFDVLQEVVNQKLDDVNSAAHAAPMTPVLGSNLEVLHQQLLATTDVDPRCVL